MKKNKIGLIYFYVHFVVEVLCFYFLYSNYKGSIVWLLPFVYDAFAFVPQSLIGFYADKNKNINMGLIGVLLMFIGYIFFLYTSVSIFIPLLIICFGNAFLHVDGAENTIRFGNGKLSNSAIFVAGGSFGVLTGRLLVGTLTQSWILLLPLISLIPLVIIGNNETKDLKGYKNYDFVKKDVNPYKAIIIAFLVVTIRGYMGYGIPTSWNKTTIELILLFLFMGTGKALGGILSDKFGIRKVAILSTLIAIPFLCFGDNIMVISLIGIMFFSMTMSITLGILLSVLKDNPGLAFGITTIGLFIGTIPIFFIKLTFICNVTMIIVFSIICSYLLSSILKGD
ncbi:MAG: hypothetical protein K6E99_03090, partial [Bacilli bacterium]|nr:hypothetical protein [Bacilli bacterium]